MAIKDHQDNLRGFALNLVTQGYLEKQIAQQSLAKAYKTHTPFIHYLLKEKLLNPNQLVTSASNYFGLPLFDIQAFDHDMLPYDLIKQLTTSQKAYVLPLFKRGKKLFVATADPTTSSLQEIKFHTNLDVIPILVNAEKLAKTIAFISSSQKTDVLDNLDEDADLDKLEITAEKELDDEDTTKLDIDEAPIVRFVNKILIDAIKKNASDIHFEPYEKTYRVRFRIDGILYEITKPPLTFAKRVTARLKVMSNLNISEHRIPQDGRFKLNLSRVRSVDFRISSCPVSNGEKIVIRILDPMTISIGIKQLGFSKRQEQIFSEVIHYPQGMILVTGPTGSGKTVTLYTALNILNTIEKNISTAEDPIEVYVDGINQVHINTKVGLTFSATLRSFLRQDPDIIMIGEIRDLETAGIAVKASQTGHLVLSTLHTNSAAETLSRLIDMGVERFDIASSVTFIIAQRLARKLCSECKAPQDLPNDILINEGFLKEEISSLKIYKAVGCNNCTKGYKGRVGIFEALHMSKTIKQAILTGANVIEINDLAVKEGTQLLRISGLNKIRQGITSLEELNRIIKE